MQDIIICKLDQIGKGLLILTNQTNYFMTSDQMPDYQLI